MKYENTKSKVRKIYIDSFNLESDLDYEDIKINQIKGKVKSNTLINKTIRSYDGGWEKTDRSYKQWEIVINKFPKNLIPFIKIQPIMKYPDASNVILSTSLSTVSAGVETSFQIQELYDANYAYIKLRIMATMAVSISNTSEIYFKLLLFVINPVSYY
jgi:hypothetical protein